MCFMRPHAEQHLEHRRVNSGGIFRLEVFITELKQGRLFQQGEADKTFYRAVSQAFIFNRVVLVVNNPGIIPLPEFQIGKGIKPLSSDRTNTSLSSSRNTFERPFTDKNCVL